MRQKYTLVIHEDENVILRDSYAVGGTNPRKNRIEALTCLALHILREARAIDLADAEGGEG